MRSFCCLLFVVCCLLVVLITTHITDQVVHLIVELVTHHEYCFTSLVNECKQQQRRQSKKTLRETRNSKTTRTPPVCKQCCVWTDQQGLGKRFFGFFEILLIKQPVSPFLQSFHASRIILHLLFLLSTQTTKEMEKKIFALLIDELVM
jgi:hypothetical protein